MLIFDIFADFRERACESVAGIRNFHKRAWCVSAFARERREECGSRVRETEMGTSECEKRFSISRLHTLVTDIRHSRVCGWDGEVIVFS